MRVKRMKSLRSFWYARRVCGFVMLANHSISGGTSARSKNSFAESARALVGTSALVNFFLGAIGELGSGVNDGVHSLTPTGCLWANMRSVTFSIICRDFSIICRDFSIMCRSSYMPLGSANDEVFPCRFHDFPRHPRQGIDL